ncbi:MAG: hypothetical protein HKP01_08720 [Gemmatimonadetes bacterium]|nr:hypothetical protein [Gemmatimonadota bacterium]
MTDEKIPSEAGTRASLSGELADLLIDLSAAFQKHSMYPAGHPALGPALRKVVVRLSSLLSLRGDLVIAVARDQLIIEGVATDREHPLLRGLAERMYRHELGLVTITAGVSEQEIAEILALLAQEPERTGRPLGQEPGEVLNSRPHVHLHPLGFKRLQLREHGGSSAAETAPCSHLWIMLADAALSGEGTDSPSSLDPGVVAQAIDRKAGDKAYDEVVSGYLLAVMREVSHTDRVDSSDLSDRVSDLIARLEPGTLGRLLRSMAGNPSQRKDLLLKASESLSSEAVVELLEASTDRQTKDVSDSMMRVLTKLARHAESGDPASRQESASAVREHVRRMVSEWQLENPNAEDYDEALQRMAVGAPIVRLDTEASSAFNPERVAQMCLEMDVPGESLQRALHELIMADSVGTIISLLDEAPADTGVVGEMWTALAKPETVQRLAAHDPPNFESIDRLLSVMGVDAAEPLLEALAGSLSRSIRWKFIERLQAIGLELGPLLVERLDDPRWYVVRNMLTLLGALPATPPGFSPEPFTRHEHKMVRLEALKLSMRIPELRDSAVDAALTEENDRVVALGLAEAEKSCPPAAAPAVRQIARDPMRDPSLRASAVRSLTRLGTPEDLEILLDIGAVKRRFLLWRELPGGGAHVLAALQGLREHWPDDSRAMSVLSSAGKLSDPDIRRALSETPEPA